MSRLSSPSLFPSISDKIALAEKEIITQYELHKGKVFVSFSGGKDSTVLLHIALRLYPDIQVVFSNTTNELSSVLKYVKNIKKVHPRFANVDVTTVKPVIDFKTVIVKHGFPIVSKEISQKVSEIKLTNGRKTRLRRYFGINGSGKLPEKWMYLSEESFNVTHKCCSILKKNPLEKFSKEQGGLAPLIALLKDESNLRKQLSLYGEDNSTINEPSKKIYPFLRTGWEEEDIWEYSRIFKFKFANCYYDEVKVIDGVPTVIKARKRTGCEFCGFGVTLEKEDRFLRSRQLSPKRFEMMMNLKNNGVTFREAINLVKSDKRFPVLGIPGVQFEKATVLKKDELNIKMNFATSTTITKKCVRCESKNLKKAFGHYGNFPDTPDPKTGQVRRVFVESDSGYDCLDCGATVIDDLHLFSMEYGVTSRLVQYIVKNAHKKSFAEVSKSCGIDFDLTYDILVGERVIKP